MCAKPHLLQGVTDDKEAFAGQDLLLHGHRVLQELHDEGQQSAAAKKKQTKKKQGGRWQTKDRRERERGEREREI